MRALSSRPLCSCGSRRVNLRYLSAVCRYTAAQPVTDVIGCSTRAAALDSSRLAALATIAIEKIVLAILRRIEERWQPGQEKADEGKQETYAYRLGHR
jgi:hypothetical protein